MQNKRNRTKNHASQTIRLFSASAGEKGEE
jgi:hypothetical protein